MTIRPRAEMAAGDVEWPKLITEKPSADIRNGVGGSRVAVLFSRMPRSVEGRISMSAQRHDVDVSRVRKRVYRDGRFRMIGLIAENAAGFVLDQEMHRHARRDVDRPSSRTGILAVATEEDRRGGGDQVGPGVYDSGCGRNLWRCGDVLTCRIVQPDDGERLVIHGLCGGIAFHQLAPDVDDDDGRPPVGFREPSPDQAFSLTLT